MEYLTFLRQTLTKSSQIAVTNFGRVASTTKAGDNNQVLTQTDLEIGQFIVSQIKSVFPDHNIIDEEAGVIDQKSDFTWVVDPIDGTSNFANGVPTYGTMIGLLQGDVPIAGGLALPSFQEIYLAQKGQGTSCNQQKLSVTAESNLLSALVAYQIDGHQEAPQLTRQECGILAEIVLKIRNLRTSNSAFDAAMLVKGSYGACLNQTSKIWDNVAQQILIEEAGGVYTDFFGQPILYRQPLSRANQNFTYCAATPSLHPQLQKLISQP